MRSKEHPFTSEDVDQQIDAASQIIPARSQSTPTTPELQVVQGLDTLYAAEAQKMNDALARGRERLAESEAAWLASQQRNELAGNHLRILPVIASDHRPQRLWRTTRWSTRLASLAAAVLLVTLVGSLVAGLILVRHSPTGAVGKGHATAQASATATSAPTQTNLYFLSLPDYWVTKFDPITKTVLWTYQWHAPFGPKSSYSLGFGPMWGVDGSFFFTASLSTGTEVSTTIYALDAQAGTLRWQKQEQGAAYVVLVEPEVVYAITVDGLDALNASDGSVRWHSPVNVGLDDLVLANGILYGTFQTNASDPWSSTLFALNANDGTLLWQTALPVGKFFTVSAVANGTLYLKSIEEKYKTNGALIATDDGKPKISYTYAYSLDGKQLWQSQQFDGYLAGLTVIGGTIYSAVSANGSNTLAFALNASNGTLLWHYQADAGANLDSGPIIANGTLYIETGSPSSDSKMPNVLIALNSQTGAVRWKQALDLPAYQLSSSCVLANGVFYILTGGFNPSSLSAFSAENGALLWHGSLGGAYAPLTIFAAP